MKPAIIEIGQGRDGGLTYLAHGYALSSVAVGALGGSATGEFSFRAGGYCLDTANVVLVPVGVSGNTTAWSYSFTAVSATLVEDAPKGSCNYTVRVTYELSITGAVTVNQLDYTVYLKGRAAPVAPDGRLSIVP